MAFLKKKEITEDIGAPKGEDMLAELERETARLGTPPMPPAPGRPPAGHPVPPARMPMAPHRAPVQHKPMLTETQVAKLPLFMKVEEYDKIVNQLHILVTSLKNMDDILEKLTKLEQEETAETAKWEEQLNRTKEQVRLLLVNMPETGKIKELLGKRKKGKQSAKIESDVEKLKKELGEAGKGKPVPGVEKEVNDLKSGINGLQDEMKHLHLELKMLNSMANLKPGKKSTMDIPMPSTKYKKEKLASPWEK